MAFRENSKAVTFDNICKSRSFDHRTGTSLVSLMKICQYLILEGKPAENVAQRLTIDLNRIIIRLVENTITEAQLVGCFFLFFYKIL